MSFVHLHVHSEFSLLDGFSKIKKLVQRAREMDMPALALTDHGTMFGVIDFFNEATKVGLKPIIGVESYLAPNGMDSRDPQIDKKGIHLLLLAENQTGYQNLLQIASAAQLQGFYYHPRIDHAFLESHSEGILCTSGCMSSEVPRLIQDGKLDKARQQLDWYYEVFGPDRYFIELQQHEIPELETINRQLMDLGRRYQARYVATNDVHYIDPQDARLQDIMLAIQTGSVLSDPNRMRMTDPSYYLRSPEEMGRLFAEVPEALSNTLMIAERCNVDLKTKGYRLPHFDVPEGETPKSYLRHLCEQGIERRYGARASEAALHERLDYELGVIHKMGFETYFLIVWDLCRYARSQSIWYNARGSAAGSIVAYTLDITLVDPLEHGLIFERFLNPSRISMPDIDLDFRDDRRTEMLEYAVGKYGADKVAQIITFGTLGARAAIRDVGRVMDVPLTEVDKVAKLIPNVPGKTVTIDQAMEEVKELKELYDQTPYLKELVDTAKGVEGVVRNAGTHAAGVIIADQPLIEYVPLHRLTGQSGGANSENSTLKAVTQFDMNVLDSLGLLKVDFLGLATLTIMARACDLIRDRHEVEFNLQNIPTDDPQTYELLGRGETAGVFQVEGTGMRRYLMQMKPQSLSNVIAMVALFRPGPMDSIPGYIRRMHGEEAVDYRHPLLEEVFNETYGYPVYQEQLMSAAMKVAGYSASEADDLRKAIAKKIKDKLHKHRQKFIDGAVAHNHIAEDTAAAIFDEWEEFARYGFNKSHAVDYGVIAVQTAYLKLHYPVEYMTALLSVSKNETAKVAFYVADCRRMGISVEPPDVNVSDWDFTIEDCPDGTAVIRFGLGAVKNVGQASVETILKARKKGEFSSLQDFAHRVDLRQVGKRSLESLIRVGALDTFGARLALLEAADRLVAVSSAHFRAAESGQMSFFGAQTGVSEDISLPPARQEVSRREILNWERELIGLYITDHPLNPVMQDLQDIVTHFSAQLAEVGAEERVRVAGIITRFRRHQTKAGKTMGFVTIEDLQGSIELVVFPRVWARFAKIIEVDRIVLVDGRVDNRDAEPKLLVDNLTTSFSKLEANEGLPEFSPAAPTRPNGGFFVSPGREAVKRTPEIEPRSIEDTRLPEAVSQDDGLDPADAGIDPGDAGMDWDSMPPEPEPPPWAGAPVAAREKVQLEALGPPVAEEEEPVFFSENPTTVAAEEDEGTQADEAEAEKDLELTPTPIVANPPDREVATSPAPALPPFLVSPLPGENEEGTVKMLTVVLRASGDKARDVLRIRRIHGIITSYAGMDRFAIHVFERGHSYLLEFPNFTCGVCDELQTRLGGIVGSENLRVDVLRFQ